ncbi:Arginine metabolism regulation II [Fusarium agapanthi]|uniref:Arginine metabolism regulation II n=1 Tax=Fusarium agapanthi TaxID=1803897 RepID=A0A9P5B132_9HYPO|nr:Arginine metabolism regulation II [Fusarium agapanthi]
MVFPGTLSRGCSRCRKRKIKCDGRRPGCRRCELYKAPCPGYDRPLAFRFHGEPGRALFVMSPEALPRRPSSWAWGSATNRRGPEAQGFDDNPNPRVIKGHLDFLEYMYRSSSRSSCIRPALLAAAHMSLSRHYKSLTLYVTARYHYGAVLRTVYRDLSASKRPLKDETLESLMLLGMIEDIECQGQTTKAVHMAGISKLFDVVGHRVITNVEESNLHSWIFTQMQITSLMAKDDMDCLVIPDSQLDTSNPVIRLALVFTRIGQFYRAARRITSADSTSTPNKQRELLVSGYPRSLGNRR